MVGCNKKPDDKKFDEWFSSQEEAIQHGLELEGIAQESIIDVEEVDNQTFVVYRRSTNQYGAAMIHKKDSKFQWFRGQSEVELPSHTNGEKYSIVKTEIKSPSNERYEISYGRVTNPDKRSISIVKDGVITEKHIYNEVFFYIQSKPTKEIDIHY